LGEAKTKCHSIEEGKQDENITRTTLNGKQLRDAERAYELLPNGSNLSEAVELLIGNLRVTKISILNGVLEYLKTKEQRSVSTYRQAKVLLMQFARWADGFNLNETSTKQINCYLKNVSLASYNNHLRAIKGFFLWAHREGLVISNPCSYIKLEKRQHNEAAVLSCDEVEALLKASQMLHMGELLPYVCITIFAGLRPDSEMKYLTWESINLEDAEIRVTKGKTQIPRTVEMPKNLQRWLLICDRTRPIYVTNFRRKWAAVRNAAGFKGGVANAHYEKEAEAQRMSWVRDYTRHTAISYRVRQTGDIHTTATWAGNSPSIIRTNYLGLVTGTEAANFWNIMP